MKEYLYNEWRLCNNSKYLHLFDEWYKNLTENQMLYYKAYSEGKKTPFVI